MGETVIIIDIAPGSLSSSTPLISDAADLVVVVVTPILIRHDAVAPKAPLHRAHRCCHIVRRCVEDEEEQDDDTVDPADDDDDDDDPPDADVATAVEGIESTAFRSNSRMAGRKVRLTSKLCLCLKTD
jgi:hypothetical protein